MLRVLAAQKVAASAWLQTLLCGGKSGHSCLILLRCLGSSQARDKADLCTHSYRCRKKPSLLQREVFESVVNFRLRSIKPTEIGAVYIQDRFMASVV
ncbi:MAG: hypothetical protein AAGF50_00300 [Pseudomonadota bacterium]